MKKKYFLKCSLILLVVLFIDACASRTMIKTKPSNAALFINGEYMGTTPYSYEDQKIIGSKNHVLLKKEGYKDFNATFSRNEEFEVGACIGGVLVVFPFLWIMKYKPEHQYLLEKKDSEKSK